MSKALDQVVINAHRTNDDTIYIEWFEVPEALRGQGLGTAAYEKFEKSLPKKIKYIRLHAADSGSGPSDPFWEAMGFGYRYDFEDEPDATSPDYEAFHEMVKGINGTETPEPIPVDDEDEG